MGAPAPLDTWLVRAICAYRAGRALPVRMSDGPSGALFRNLGQAHIQSRLDKYHHDQYLAIRDLARAAVTAAGSGQLAAADEHFASAEQHLLNMPPNEEVRLLSRSWIDQAYAYLAVRRKDWQVSRERLAAAMASDLALEEQFGYELFHIGRVHTLHLWVRTELEAGQRRIAMELAQAIVDYVNGHRDDLPIGYGWTRARAAAVPDELRLAMTARISGEAGTILARCEQSEAAELLDRFPAWRRFAAHERLPEIHEWGMAKAAFVAGDTALFLAHAERMLARGRRETTLWYATALDVCRTLDAMRPTAAGAFRDEVREDAKQWRHLPTDLHAPVLFSLLARETRTDAPAVYAHRPAARRFHVCSVGLPRTGTTSLYTLFEGFRTGNEFMERETIRQCVARHQGALSTSDFAAYLERRDREGALEMDAASFHHLYLDVLLEMFPDAKFVFTIRSPYEWTNSYLKMIHGWHQRFTASGEPLPGWMEQYGQMLFGAFSWDWVASKASIEARLEELVDAFVAHWARANRRTLSLLPTERSLLIRTEELSRRRSDIERFMALRPGTLSGSDHSNIHPDRTDLLASLGREWVAARAAAHGADVLDAADMAAA